MLIVGPAGSGKSTFCHYMHEHFQILKRSTYVINFDPACDDFNYDPIIDIRDLITLDDVTDPDEDLRLGPNGGLVYCLEYISKNLDWLDEVLTETTQEDDLILIDCPGQIELYTHLDCFQSIIKKFESHNFKMMSTFLLDAQFLSDCDKYMGGVLAALSCMIKLELPHINVMTKMDLLSASSREKLIDFMDPVHYQFIERPDRSYSKNKFKTRQERLTNMLFKVIEDYSMVRFLPINREDENDLMEVTRQIDLALQYGEDLEVKPQDFDEGPVEE